MPSRVLTPDARLRALLARQLLLERAELPVPRALQRICGLQTQHAPSGYLGLHARLAGFAREDLTGALHAGRVQQAWAMRSTIHMLTPRDRAVFCAAVRDEQRAAWLRERTDLAPGDPPAAADAVRDLLAGGPRRQAEITAELTARGLARGAFPAVQHWVELVRVPPAGTWDTPRAHVYGLAPRPRADPDPAAARVELARRYLRAFGPASAPDVARFAGWPVGVARAALGELSLRRFTGSAGGELLDLPGAPRPDPRTPAPARLLGPFDAVLLLGHAAGAEIVPAAHRHRVFATSKPRSEPTFLVGGRVAGTWAFRDGRVVCAPFDELGAADRRAVGEEAERLTAWYAAGAGGGSTGR